MAKYKKAKIKVRPKYKKMTIKVKPKYKKTTIKVKPKQKKKSSIKIKVKTRDQFPFGLSKGPLVKKAKKKKYVRL